MVSNITKPETKEIKIVASVDNPASMHASPLQPRIVKNPIRFLKLIGWKAIVASFKFWESEGLVALVLESGFRKINPIWIKKIKDAGIVINQ